MLVPAIIIQGASVTQHPLGLHVPALFIMAKKPADEGVLVSAARTIGKAAGTVAALTGLESPAPPAPAKAAAKGKLQKKNKVHLPRRMKKAQKKMQAAS